MIHRVVRGIARFLVWLFVKLDVQGLEHIPEKGPALLVCNHVNLMDPVVPLGVVRRPVSFMAKEELFSIPIFGRLLCGLKIVPVARGRIASRRALQRAEELLLEGWVFSIYPEGTRSRIPGMGPAHHGASLLALRTGVPVLPSAVTGTHMIMREGRFFPRRGPVSFRIGPPLQVEPISGKIERPRLEELTERIMRRIAALLPPEYRGFYAGEPAVVGVSQ
jgi:1-acyl-sn-glycerol-3-phosphate acyltransferase